MGLLDKLWDDTLAGPRPDSGLGRLRKYSTFSFRSPTAAAKEESIDAGNGKSIDDGPSPEEAPKVTRSIMIKRPLGCPSPGNGTPPASPAGSTPPVSPFSGGGAREWNRFRRKSLSDTCERGGEAVGVGSSTRHPSHEV